MAKAGRYGRAQKEACHSLKLQISFEDLSSQIITNSCQWEFFLGQRGLKNYFGTVAAKAAA
jgi:hypothetical protein